MTPNQHRERAERLAAEIRNQVDEILCDEGREELDIVNTLCAAFAEVEAESVPRWIPVGTPPEKAGEYIVVIEHMYTGKRATRPACYYPNDWPDAPWRNIHDKFIGFAFGWSVILWSPLPPAPSTQQVPHD
jgi:hypothetical protein